MNLRSIIINLEPAITKIILENYYHNYYVIGEGDVDANILIIGEAMGKQEEQQLRIFVGASGKLVRKTLHKYNIQRFFIINTMPIRPKNNATPTIDEIKLFAPIYQQIIKMPQFKHIIALGKCAALLLNNINIHSYTKLYHPAYILYSGYNKQILDAFENGFKNIGQQINAALESNVSYIVFKGSIDRKL